MRSLKLFLSLAGGDTSQGRPPWAVSPTTTRAKLFFIAVFILLAFLSLITVFLPSKVTVSKTILIKANENEVALQIANFENWKNWYPAFQNKNVTVKTFQKNDTSFAAITDEKQRKLLLVLLKSVPGNIDILLSEENKNKVTYQFILLPHGTGQTQLTWNVNTTLDWYPWKKLAGIFLDKITGPQYEEALQNLKATIENAAH